MAQDVSNIENRSAKKALSTFFSGVLSVGEKINIKTPFFVPEYNKTTWMPIHISGCLDSCNIAYNFTLHF